MEIRIGSTLKALMAQKRVSLREVARDSGVPYSTLQEWTHNRAPKNPVQIQKVAKYLGVTMHYLIFGEGDLEEPLVKLLKEDVFSGTFEINIKRIKTKQGVSS